MKLEPTDALIDQIAHHFAEHRRNVAGWAAKRLHAGFIDALEAASTSQFPHRGEEWIRGFWQAEETVCAIQPLDLLELRTGAARSKGQILRNMVRQARQP
ncbi:MAG: hypothetical protein WDM96_13655 [Lacunisphaera sp.]